MLKGVGSKLPARLGAALLGLGLAFGAGHWTARRTAPDPAVVPVCRPSAPQRAADHAGTPLVLLLGNSLVFDHDWRIPGVTVANCARQGLVARDAPGLVAALPAMAPGTVVLGFGSVEALRAGLAGHPIAPAAFDTAARAVTQAVRARWPGAGLVWLTLPETGPGPIRPGDVETLNGILAALAAADPGVRLLDVNRPPATGPDAPVPVSYDGVHLAERTYLGWERALADLVAGR